MYAEVLKLELELASSEFHLDASTISKSNISFVCCRTLSLHLEVS